MGGKEGGKTLKTFNLDSELYREFSEHCKRHGISMSKRVENFIRRELESMKSGLEDTRGIQNEVKKVVKDTREHSMERYC